MLRFFWNNLLIIFNFLFIDECSSPSSYFDDDFQDVDIKEEPLEYFDVSFAVIFLISYFGLFWQKYFELFYKVDYVFT